MPRKWAEKAYPKLAYYKRHPKGAHFAAWEQPQALVEDAPRRVQVRCGSLKVFQRSARWMARQVRVIRWVPILDHERSLIAGGPQAPHTVGGSHEHTTAVRANARPPTRASGRST